ncbi:MAG TPA: hypothetical protein VNL16_07055 [Chloroflexota bacterium]|nr:hypothetical protein [Chloroflexota bacterium]
MRAHLVIPQELVDEVDEIVGPRCRSKFVTEAVREKLAHIRRVRAAREVAGSLAGVDIPGWESSDSAVRWVRSLRQLDNERLEETLNR